MIPLEMLTKLTLASQWTDALAALARQLAYTVDMYNTESSKDDCPGLMAPRGVRK